MKKLVLLAILFTAPLSAVLPPVWQGVAEVKAILNDPDLSQHLDSAEILESIAKTDQGWLISTNRSHLLVKVIYERQSMPGAQKFKLKYSLSQKSN